MSSQIKPSEVTKPRTFDRNAFVSLVQNRAPQGIFTINTLAHIVLPAVVGASLAGMLTYIDVQPKGKKLPLIPPPSIETKRDVNPKKNAEELTKPKIILYYLTYSTVAIISSSLVTLGLIGLPENENERIKSWLITSVGAITLPVTLSTRPLART